MHQQTGLSEFSEKKLKLVAVHLGVGNSRDQDGSKRLAKQICEEIMLNITTTKPTTKNESSSKQHKKSCSKCNSCGIIEGINEQRDHISAESAVVQLVTRMENHHSLNCGYGSNLNVNCQVECDASLMSDSTQSWAGVGAVSGCKNPILLAKSLNDHRTVQRPLGLIQPNFLVGSGAKQWMREHCPDLSVMDSRMISPGSLSLYQKFKSRYDVAERLLEKKSVDGTNVEATDTSPSHYIPEQSITQDKTTRNSATLPTHLDHGSYCLATSEKMFRQYSSSVQTETDTTESFVVDHPYSRNPAFVDGKIIHQQNDCDIFSLTNIRLDTVGAVAVDSNNNFASAISSGGLLLKYKGRIGQAAIPGAGCWAEDSIAVTTTGVGEYLTASMFAKRFYDKMSTLRLLYDLGHVEKKENDLSDLINSVIGDCFEDLFRLPALCHVPLHERSAGMLSVSSLNSRNLPKRVHEDDLYLSFAHNTKSMCIGYMTHNDTTGHSIMSHNEDNDGSVLVKTMKFPLD